MITTTLIFYMVGIVIDVNGAAISQTLGAYHSMSDCFEAREYVLHMSGHNDPAKKLEDGLQVICVGKEVETI